MELLILHTHNQIKHSGVRDALTRLPLGSYHTMAMGQTQTQFGEKYIMLLALATDQNGTLGLCYSNKEIERFLRENLTDEQREI